MSTKKTEHYRQVKQQPAFSEIEQEVLAFWEKEKIFEKSVEQRPASLKDGSSNEFVFYDGPPFANGLPHYGHLLTGFVKDAVPRYQTMRGKRVERRFGWDCHGLPAEMESEKELNISGRQQIEQFGIKNFNSHCATSVLKYTREWETYVRRQARWVDFSNDYKTMDLSYMESVLWAFKQLWEKGLVYEGYKVMPYSWACETPLSNFETRMDNSYRPRQDPAVTVAFSLNPQAGETSKLKLLVWTTTPWTLPSNLAVAVGSEISYALMQEEETTYVLAEAALEKYEKQLANARRTGTIKGKDLQARTYQPLFPYFSETRSAFRVLEADFVNTDEGTGIVHMAPGFGEDDQKVCEANGIEIVCPVDNAGKFTAEVSDYQGLQVLEANKQIISDLKTRGVLIKHESYEHNYPHCWRTDTPLIYKALSSWYVKVTDFKDRMVELNQQINWIPSHIKDGQFGKWLENARDWSISRNRFWGTPIPVWKSDNPEYPRIDVYGSLDELEQDFGVRPDNLHRTDIDELVRPNPDDPSGKSMMRRVPEVFDCWFESGSMPFAQMHYPFENKEWFDKNFPADFIVEYVAQTRGWFYTLMVLATALFDKHPFRNCICHGVVVDENGQKLSKRLRNYPTPEEVFSSYGADALRWFMLSSPVLRGLDIQIDSKGSGIADVLRSIINPIWNAYYFFTLYANSDGVKAQARADSNDLLDRYILAKTGQLHAEITKAFDEYELTRACSSIITFIDVLNNWYIRRSRDRFWKHDKDQDKVNAYNTLFFCLVNLCKMGAPLLPLINEEIFRGLTGEQSVHLTDWPQASLFPHDTELVRAMDLVREVCSAGLSIRESREIRTRQPLKALIISGEGLSILEPYSVLIKDELNVKEVRFEKSFDSHASLELSVNARALGPRLGARTAQVIKASKQGDWIRNEDGSVTVAGEKLEETEYSLRLVAKEGVAGRALNANRTMAVLDLELNQELLEEGVARDLVRLVQQSRKEADLHIADRITLSIKSPDAKLKDIIERHKSYICEQTLAIEVAYDGLERAHFNKEGIKLGEFSLELSLSRSS